MAHTYTALKYHVVFSTKQREPRLIPAIRERVWSYLGGIARENDMSPIAVGGVADHVHLLLSIPATLAVAKAIQLLKGGSSRWLNGGVVVGGRFAWQDGYGGFTVSESQVNVVRHYILGQEEHHRHTTFADEYRAFLRRHGVEYDERYVLD